MGTTLEASFSVGFGDVGVSVTAEYNFQKQKTTIDSEEHVGIDVLVRLRKFRTLIDFGIIDLQSLVG